MSFDLDGTIFKKGLDDIFWNRLIPELVAREKGISIDDAVGYVLSEYDSIGPSDIRWYIPEYWFSRFGLTCNLLDDLLGRMEECYYADGMYDDVHLLAEIGSRYKVIISTCNPPAMAMRKLSIIRKTGIRIDALFSSISYNMVKSHEFYSIVCRELNLRPESILHVGDDAIQDLKIPRSVGMQAILMDRGCKDDGAGYRSSSSRIASNNEGCYEGDVVCSMKELLHILMKSCWNGGEAGVG